MLFAGFSKKNAAYAPPVCSREIRKSVLRKTAEPTLLIPLSLPTTLPESFGSGSIPAKAMRDLLEEKRRTSPISAISRGQREGPTPYISITVSNSGTRWNGIWLATISDSKYIIIGRKYHVSEKTEKRHPLPFGIRFERIWRQVEIPHHLNDKCRTPILISECGIDIRLNSPLIKSTFLIF